MNNSERRIIGVGITAIVSNKTLRAREPHQLFKPDVLKSLKLLRSAGAEIFIQVPAGMRRRVEPCLDASKFFCLIGIDQDAVFYESLDAAAVERAMGCHYYVDSELDILSRLPDDGPTRVAYQSNPFLLQQHELDGRVIVENSWRNLQSLLAPQPLVV